MNRNMVIGLIVLILLVGGSVLFAMSRNNSSPAVTSVEPLPTTVVEPTQNDTQMPASSPSSTGSAMSDIKEFTVTGSGFKFTPVTLTVKQGDTVRVTYKNAGGMHDFVIDEFNVKTKVLADGGEETVEFVANQKGSFEYYCSVGNHRAMGMKGTLVVE
jgi:plastocyanin